MAIVRRRSLRSFRAWAVLLGLALAWASAGPSAGEAPGRLRVGKPHRLRVTHTTRVRVPEGTARLKVVQARPIDRPWPGLKAPLGVQQAAFAPPGAEEVATPAGGGAGWTWQVAAPPAGEADFVSTFEVLSADRDLKVAGLVIPWADLPTDTTELMQGLPALPIANDALREVVAKLKKKGKDVIDVLTAFAQWVSSNIAYTPGVAYRSEDLEAICKGRGGHCGHRATVYLALCQAAGIPARRVVGYALLNHPLAAGVADDGNRHVWVQVHLPTLGWVEVEPAPHGSPFAIPYTHVLCPLDLQSRFVAAVTASGAETSPVVSDTLRMEEVK